jgi:hypothetical protein
VDFAKISPFLYKIKPIIKAETKIKQLLPTTKGIATANAIVREFELYSDELELLPSFPVNVLETIGKPPREEPALAPDRAVRPEATAAALEASDDPERIVDPE